MRTKASGPARGKRPFDIQSRTIDAKFVADVDEDAASIKLPKILARICQLPIDGANNVASLCVQQDGTNHSDGGIGFGCSRASNERMWIKGEEQLLRAEPSQRFLVFKIADDLVGTRRVPEGVNRY